MRRGEFENQFSFEIADKHGEFFEVCAVHRENPRVQGAGFSKTVEMAKKIALAEALERHSIFEISGSEERAKFLFESYPTSCGCAAGFDSHLTQQRSLFEAVERWAWSQLVDRGNKISKEEVDSSGLCFFDEFEDSLFLKKTLAVSLGEALLKLDFHLFLGIVGNGLYPGSRVSLSGLCDWQHAVVEAWRWRRTTEGYTDEESLYTERAKFFSENKELGLSQVGIGEGQWPIAEVSLSITKSYETHFFCRTLCKNFLGWHVGPLERFVY